MEIFFEAAAIAILLIIGAGIIIRNNSPSAKYRKTEKEYLSKANQISQVNHVYRVTTRKEFDDFSLDAFLIKAVEDGSINRYIKQIENVIGSVNQVRNEFMSLNTTGVSASTLAEVKEDARVEFDRIARDKDFFTVICLYVDEQGKRMMTSSMCEKKYLVHMVKKQRYGGLM